MRGGGGEQQQPPRPPQPHGGPPLRPRCPHLSRGRGPGAGVRWAGRRRGGGSGQRRGCLAAEGGRRGGCQRKGRGAASGARRRAGLWPRGSGSTSGALAGRACPAPAPTPAAFPDAISETRRGFQPASAEEISARTTNLSPERPSHLRASTTALLGSPTDLVQSP